MIREHTRQVSEAKRREVVQLLREYRSWHSPFGGAMPTDEGHLRSADYGPAGLVEAGAYYDRKDRRLLAESYEYLAAALTLLRREDFEASISLIPCYTGADADPSLVVHWRKTRKRYVSSELFVERHDRAVAALAGYLVNVDLYVVFPARMTSREEKEIERRNDELWALYLRLREDGLGKTKAVESSAQYCGYGKTRAWEIVWTREKAAG